MKSRKRLNRYNAFKQKTKDLCNQLKENTIIADCINAKPIHIDSIRIFQDGVIKINVAMPKKSKVMFEINQLN